MIKYLTFVGGFVYLSPTKVKFMSKELTPSEIIDYVENELHIKKDDYKNRQKETCSLKYFQDTYGQDIGTKKWKDWDTKRKENFKNLIKSDKPTSKIADTFFAELMVYFPGHKIWTNITEEKEFHIGNYSLDFYDETLNIVVEFYGDFWHCNPEKFNSDDLVTFSENNQKYAKDVWLKDDQRKKYIEKKLNTKVFIVWQNQYTSNSFQCIKNLMNEISDFQNNQKRKIIPLF